MSDTFKIAATPEEPCGLRIDEWEHLVQKNGIDRSQVFFIARLCSGQVCLQRVGKRVGAVLYEAEARHLRDWLNEQFPPAREDAMTLRRLVWLLHGCNGPALYGEGK